MAHDIETYGDQAAAAFARISAWHTLGHVADADAMTAEEIMRYARLGGWGIYKTPVQATLLQNDGVETVEVPKAYMIARTNPFTGRREVLSNRSVGEQYTPIQNEEHAAFLNALVDEGGAVFDTAGSLDGGRRVFITMRMPESIMVGGVDRVDLNIAALNAHDGSATFRTVVTPIRVVCANTERAALSSNSGIYSVRHTKNASAAVEEARAALDLSFRYVKEFEAEAEKMIQTTCTDAEFFDIMGRLYGKPDEDATDRTWGMWERKEQQLAALWFDAKTQEGVRGTRWAAYNVVTEHADHFSRVQAGGGSVSERRAERVLAGAFDALKARAWRECAVTA